ncbi:hypothetical protein M5G07_11115 [Serratia symbiotica]|nr:hypothetical protein [Serratia symbiotica]
MNNSHLASIAHSEKICFDYMDFLSASRKKHWHFVYAVYGVMPIFGMVLKSRVTMSQTRNEQLKELVLQVVSTQVRDETNIVRLIELAAKLELVIFDIQLPYTLKVELLAVIQKECVQDTVITLKGERISITIPAKNYRVVLCGKNDFFSLSQLVDLNHHASGMLKTRRSVKGDPK